MQDQADMQSSALAYYLAPLAALSAGRYMLQPSSKFHGL